jgi:DUF4097 and DUF4098 domain-containing protein YvlB
MRAGLLLVFAAVPMLFGGIENRWIAQLAAGQTIEIKNINGSIRAEPADGDQVEIIAQQKGDSRVSQVSIVQHEGGVVVRNGDNVRVDFLVRVPSHVRFIARTINGAVDAKLLDSQTEAHTVNGDIHLSTTESATAETTNGSIDAVVGKIIDGTMFRTVNGRISLQLPLGEAMVRAHTVHGEIANAMPLRSKHSGHAPELRVTTVNGPIELNQSHEL